uniref:NADH:ubiquinone reductase (H(+)-translocating) n=2 Tax=Ixodes scapularis TaxID=6945 RepID=A0A1S4LNK0_IXOSC
IEYRLNSLNQAIIIYLNLVLLFFLVFCHKITNRTILKYINNNRKSLFYGILLFAHTGYLGMISTNDFFNLYVFIEISALSSYVLIVSGNNPKSLIGAFDYLIMGSIGATLILIAIGFLLSITGSLNILVENYFSKNQSIILLLMFIFGIAKTAIFPVHSWLPAAMVAHYPVSSLLHAVIVVKTGLFCIYKILLYIFGLSYLQMIFAEFNWLIFIPIVSIFYSSIKALGTDNIKKILAYSTMNQLSIALLSAFMLTPKALGAAILHLVSHSFSKICLFYSMGSIYSLKKANQIQNLHGVSKEFPLISFIISISSLSLIGIPIFSGFISKFSILLAASEQNQIIVMIVIIASSIFSSLYLLKILSSIYKPSLVESSVIKSLPYSMRISI